MKIQIVTQEDSVDSPGVLVVSDIVELSGDSENVSARATYNLIIMLHALMKGDVSRITVELLEGEK